MSSTATTSVSGNLVRRAEVSTTLIPISVNPEHDGDEVSTEDVRLAAYLNWEAAGRPICDGVQFWYEAEQQLRSTKKTSDDTAESA